MSREVTGILQELEGILEKRAAAPLSQDGGGYGDAAAGPHGSPQMHKDKTKGAGRPSEVGPGKSNTDGAAEHGIEPGQRTKDKVMKYNYGDGEAKKGPNSDADTADSEVSGYADHSQSKAKSAEMANNILRGLRAMSMGGTNGHTMKQAGEATAEQVLQRLIQAELQKVAMSAEELAGKWDSMSSEEKEKLRSEMPELVEKAMALKHKGGGGDSDYEKMSHAQRAEYEYYKQAGAQAAVDYLTQLSGGQPQYSQDDQYELQKQAALNDYIQSRELGRQAAERDLAIAQQQAMMAKQAGYAAAQEAMARGDVGFDEDYASDFDYAHPAMGPSPQEAYDTMLKAAHEAGINPDALHGMLSDVYRAAAVQGGTPHPFRARGHVTKSAVDVAPLYPVLSGLLDEGTIDPSEKEALLNYLAGVEDLTEDALRTATEDLKNPEAVLKRILAGDVQQHQRNTHRADSPKPAMPATQPSPSAETAEETRTVSEGGDNEDIPGSTEEGAPNEDNLDEMIVEAALRRALRRIDPAKYKTL